MMRKSKKVVVNLAQGVHDFLKNEASDRCLTVSGFVGLLLSEYRALRISGTQPIVNTGVGFPKICEKTLQKGYTELNLAKIVQGCPEGEIQQDGNPRIGGKRRSRSGYRGVYAYGKRVAPMIWDAKAGKLRRIGKPGGYDDPKEAAVIYDAEARMMYGTAAILNFPTKGERRQGDGNVEDFYMEAMTSGDGLGLTDEQILKLREIKAEEEDRQTRDLHAEIQRKFNAVVGRSEAQRIEDTVLAWVEEETSPSDVFTTQARDAYVRATSWAQGRGLPTTSLTAFGKLLKGLVPYKRTNKGICYCFTLLDNRPEAESQVE